MKTRDHLFDNTKAILIFLVVLGHLMEPFLYNKSIMAIYIFIYTFHMPLFIFISGFFVKPGLKGIKNLIILLIKFQIIYSIVTVVLIYFSPELGEYLRFADDAKNSGFTDLVKLVLTPFWSLWYLLSLIIWKVLITLVYKYNKYLVFTVAVVLSIIIVIYPYDTRLFSIARTVSFFPFYLMGYYLTKEHLNKILVFFKKRNTLIISSIIAVVAFVVIYKLQILDENSFYYVEKQSTITQFNLLGRICALYISTYMCLIVLSNTSHEENKITHIGKNTLGIYIYHIIVFLVLYSLGFYNFLGQFSTPIIMSVLILLSASICIIFAKGGSLWRK